MRINKKNKITMLAIVGLGLLNPFSQVVLADWFSLAYTVIAVGCAVWIMGYIVYSVTRPEVVNIPNKKHKAKVKTAAYNA